MCVCYGAFGSNEMALLSYQILGFKGGVDATLIRKIYDNSVGFPAMFIEIMQKWRPFPKSGSR